MAQESNLLSKMDLNYYNNSLYFYLPLPNVQEDSECLILWCLPFAPSFLGLSGN